MTMSHRATEQLVESWARTEPAARRLAGSELPPGRLIVIEGTDRSGRSTQVDLLVGWLISQGRSVVQTDWSTSPHISKAIHEAKADGTLRPITYSLFYAADFADRVSSEIVPALERGDDVVADRYIYTGFARDAARGADREWLRTLYSFAPKPDLIFYLRVPPEVTYTRLPSVAVKARDRYEIGLDLGLSADPAESFHLYQRRVFEEFELLTVEFGLVSIDGQQDARSVHRLIRERVQELLRLSG